MTEQSKKDVGAILKAERETRGLTLEVVQEATKIPLDSLRAIEEGYKIRTLTSFYYKSFVKLYAKYLGIDPAPLLAVVPAYQPVPAAPSVERKPAPARVVRPVNLFAGPAKKTVSATKKVFPTLAIVAGVLLAGAGMFFAGKFVLHKMEEAKLSAPVKKPVKVKNSPGVVKKVERVPKVERVERAPKVEKTDRVEKVEKADRIEKLERSDRIERGEKTGEKSNVPEKSNGVEKTGKIDKNEQLTTVPVTSKKNEDVAEPKEPGSPEVVAPKPRNVSVAVRAPVTAWLMVRVDGAAVFQGSLKKGSSESWTGTKRIEISGRNVDQLEFELNGKVVGKISHRDTKVRKVILTPEGFTIEK